MQSVLCSITPPINQELLKEQLSSTLPGLFFGLNNGGPNQITVVLIDAATQANRDTAASVCAAHDGTLLSTAQQKSLSDNANLVDIQTKWRASALHGQTPAQIYATMQNAIDGWASLAAAKADLRVWLPAVVAALAWTIMKDQQRD